jgi:hypothetical protein
LTFIRIGYTLSMEKNLKKQLIYLMEIGMEYAQESLARYDAKLGRTTKANKRDAEDTEKEIEDFKKMIEKLQSLEEKP